MRTTRSSPKTDEPSRELQARRRHEPRWTWIAALELVLVTLAVVFDWFVPTFVILGLAAVSLAVRRKGLASFGFSRPRDPGRMTWQILGLVLTWTLLHLALFMPVLERLTGETQDLSGFEQVEGNLGTLMLFLALTWTLAAIGEETAYRGFIHKRAEELLGGGRWGLGAAVLVSATLFGLAHTEQGLVGVGLTSLDALFFSSLLIRYETLWAPVLAHGFSNTIGLVAFYFVGPIYGLW